MAARFAKLRTTLPITENCATTATTNRVDSMEGCFYRFDRLRLKESGEWLHSEDVLLDILKRHETYVKAVPTDAGDNGDHFFC